LSPQVVKRSERRGFTLVEALVATALVGFSLIVMFGFHSQAVRSNMHARRLTDCTYLAQRQIERMATLPWTSASLPTDLTDTMGVDPTSATDVWAWLEHPDGGVQPSAVNASAGSDSDVGPLSYYVTWDVEYMDTDPTWLRLRVRCQYRDETFSAWRGTTVSAFRFRD
jgi:type II secretory pathway pseudopilin PulG